MKTVAPPRLITLREYERLDYALLEDPSGRQLEQGTEHLGVPVFRFFREEA